MNTEKVGWRVPEWSAATGLSRSSVYELLKENIVQSVKFGGARIIVTPPATWLASLTAEVAQ